MIDFKSMRKKEKAEYIWDYYRLHIIGALAAILIIGSLVYSQVTKIDYVFNLTMIGNEIDESKITDLEKQISSLVIKEGEKRKQAIVDIMPSDGSNNVSGLSSQYMQKFIAETSAGEIDVVVLDKSMLETLAKHDEFSRLDNIAQLDLAAIKDEKIEAYGRDNNKAVYAVNAESIKILKDMGFDTRNKVIAIMNSSKQKDKAALVLKRLLINKGDDIK